MKMHELTERICAVIHLAHQHPMVLHRVVLDPAKVISTLYGKDLIRVGDYPGDEAAGWNFLEAIEILHVLGTVEYELEKPEVKITPYHHA